jgi:hypothetical protein
MVRIGISSPAVKAPTSRAPSRNIEAPLSSLAGLTRFGQSIRFF